MGRGVRIRPRAAGRRRRRRTRATSTWTARRPRPQPRAATSRVYDDRDHRKSRLEPVRQEAAAPQPTYPRRPAEPQPQMRQTGSAQPTPEPQLGSAEDDLEIPSFLRRLAN